VWETQRAGHPFAKDDDFSTGKTQISGRRAVEMEWFRLIAELETQNI